MNKERDHLECVIFLMSSLALESSVVIFNHLFTRMKLRLLKWSALSKYLSTVQSIVLDLIHEGKQRRDIFFMINKLYNDEFKELSDESKAMFEDSHFLQWAQYMLSFVTNAINSEDNENIAYLEGVDLEPWLSQFQNLKLIDFDNDAQLYPLHKGSFKTYVEGLKKDAQQKLDDKLDWVWGEPGECVVDRIIGQGVYGTVYYAKTDKLRCVRVSYGKTFDRALNAFVLQFCLASEELSPCVRGVKISRVSVGGYDYKIEVTMDKRPSFTPDTIRLVAMNNCAFNALYGRLLYVFQKVRVALNITLVDIGLKNSTGLYSEILF